MVVQKILAVNSFTCTQQPQRRLVMRLFHSFLSVIAAFVLGGISLYIVAPSTSYFNRIGQNFQFFIRFQNLICPIAFHAREDQDTLSASACQYYASTMPIQVSRRRQVVVTVFICLIWTQQPWLQWALYQNQHSLVKDLRIYHIINIREITHSHYSHLSDNVNREQLVDVLYPNVNMISGYILTKI